MLNVAVLSFALAGPAASDPALKAEVQAIFEESCTLCHDASDDLNLEGDPDLLIGQKSSQVDQLLVAPGDAEGSYLLIKMTGKGPMEGDLMPQGEDPLPAEQLQKVASWIASAQASEAATAPEGEATGLAEAGIAAGEGGEAPADGAAPVVAAADRGTPPFHGTTQIVLPTTTTLGKLTLQYRIDHRFGRIGTERGFLGLDAGVVMSLGIALGIVDGWDVQIRRTNTLKGWEFATKYIPVRQEDGMPLSFGAYVSMDVLAAETVGNRVSGNFMAMLSRLWFDRWSTMLVLSYHTTTNHEVNPMAIFDEAEGPVPVEDTRGTLAIGLASTVWLGKKKRWGIDLEYWQPIPTPGQPPVFYVRGGDQPEPEFTPTWGLGGSYSTGKHFFQVFFTNNRQIHPNLAAPGGQTRNPFDAPDLDPGSNPFRDFNFYLGFNLGRQFTLGKNAKRWKRERQERRKAREAEASSDTAAKAPVGSLAAALPETVAAAPVAAAEAIE